MTTNEVIKLKDTLRNEAKIKLRSFSLDCFEHERLSRLLAEKLFSFDGIYKASEVLLSYLPLKTEVNTELIIEKALRDKKKVYIPSTVRETKEMEFFPLSDNLPLEEQVRCGNYSIREPVDCSSPFKINEHRTEKILLLVPGLLFTSSGERLGRGGGFYDRYIERLKGKNVTTLSLCFAFQLRETLPTLAHDAKVQYVLSA